MSFDLEVAHEIVKEMRATDWLKYEDDFGMLTWFPEALTEIETLRIRLDAAHRLIKEQDVIIKKFESGMIGHGDL